MMVDKLCLTQKQAEWAHKKWCEGYTLEEIAEALLVCPRTVSRTLKHYGFHKVKKPLVYPFQSEVTDE